MLPYASSIGLRSGLNTLPGSLVMGLPNSNVSQMLSPSPMQLSVNVNNNLINKDSQWLTLEVCREYQRGLCPRSDLECKYAHPPPYLETVNGRVVCCYDSIKGKCHRVKPPCKYLHPPQHLKDILIQNGKNNLLMKNLQMNIMQQQLSTLTGAPQSRLGLIAVNPKSLNESQKSPDPDSTISTTSADCSYSNFFNLPNDVIKSEIPFSTECQTSQCLSPNVYSGPPVSMSKVTPSSMLNVDACIAKKRTLTQMYQNGVTTHVLIEQQSEDPVPAKRPMLSETHQPALTMNRDQSYNPMGYLVNPFMAYQNPLATYLALNNQMGLQCNGLNMAAVMTNSSQFPQMGPGLICSSPAAGVNNLSIVANLQNQQHLAMILNAVNNFPGNRAFSDFSTFK